MRETNYCDNCKVKRCELRGYINFCEDCKDYHHCDILSTCKDGHYVECNNGFEPCCEYDDDDEEQEDL